MVDVEKLCRDRQRWTEIYTKNVFGALSRSGSGSGLEQTSSIRRLLPRLLRCLEIRTFIDAPCGDFWWMQSLKLPVKRYIGIDIVEEVIRVNMRDHARAGRAFMCMNITHDALPEGDIIFSRDCLVHMNDNDILDTLRNFKASAAKYLLTTTFSGRTENGKFRDNALWDWRPINLTVPPFSLPAPRKVFSENCTELNGLFADKCLALWKLSDLDP